MSALTSEVIAKAQALPEGSILSPKEFLHLASRAAVDQALSRLSREGKLVRVSRGLYTLPTEGRFGPRLPSAESLIQAIEAASGEVVVANGAAEANALGLTTQVPIREIFLTSGPSRKLRLGKRQIELRHGPRWQLMMGKRPAGRVVRALSWMGPEHAPSAVARLKRRLSEAEWEELRRSSASLPSWMARLVSEA